MKQLFNWKKKLERDNEKKRDDNMKCPRFYHFKESWLSGTMPELCVTNSKKAKNIHIKCKQLGGKKTSLNTQPL